MKKIVLIEDDASVRNSLTALLQSSGYEVSVITDFANVSGQLERADADLVLLDINLPGLNGQEVLARFRQHSTLPVIMVTSRTSESDEVLSMSYGADDYITKPYNPTILLLRIAALFRRIDGNSQKMCYHGLSVQPAKGMLSDGERELFLTKNEMIIFELLLIKQGQLVTRDELMTALWDNEEYVNDNALTVNISRLRSKLAELGYPDAIKTRVKLGYLLT